jgi:hypothetical protein
VLTDRSSRRTPFSRDGPRQELGSEGSRIKLVAQNPDVENLFRQQGQSRRAGVAGIVPKPVPIHSMLKPADGTVIHRGADQVDDSAVGFAIEPQGLFHVLQNIRSLPELQAHPKLGASWEGLALEHILRVLRAEPGEAFYWSTHGGAELDLMLVRGGRRWGFALSPLRRGLCALCA